MRIGIVGAGIAGLSTAWMLEGSGHEVVLFDMNDYAGGHAHTVIVHRDGKDVDVDTATSSQTPSIYPNFLALMDRLDVPVESTQATVTVHSKPAGQTLMMVPTLKFESLVACLRPAMLQRLVQFNKAIDLAAVLERNGDWSMSVREFLMQLPAPFATAVMHPFMAGVLGTSDEEILEFSARAAMKFLVCPRAAQTPLSLQGLRVRGGTGAYVKALLRQLRDTTVKLRAEIISIRKEGPGFFLTEQDGNEHFADQVVLASPAYKTHALLANLAGATRLRDMLGNMRYLETAIAVHGDPSFMPPHRRAWSFVNFMIDRPGHCEKTFWCGINRDVDIFRSWVTLSDRTPSNLYGMYRYHHPRMTPAYFRTQAQLAVVPPGEGGLWLAGSYLLDVDMHESGLVSAMRVIKHLHPESRNLRALQKVDVAKKFPKVARMYDLAEST